MTDRLYADIHVIETLPPSCVNRDDLGSPKTAFYGGTVRARVSSQAWKSAVRESFRETMGKDEIGKRTKHICELVSDKIMRLAPDFENPEKAAKDVLTGAGFSFSKKKTEEVDALAFISPAQINALAELAIEEGSEDDPTKDKQWKKKCVEAANKNPSIDIALFGRMVASNPSLNNDAASQVAHAISTHETHNEFDFFTAVDDVKAEEEETGAGHMGVTEFNSAVMYRYATVNAMELQKNLGAETAGAIRLFAEAFIKSMPTGKQNSFANGVRPDAVYIAVRKDRPVNMAGAFEKAVPPSREGYVGASIKRLVDYAKETYDDYYPSPAFELVVGKGMEALSARTSLSDALNKLEERIKIELSAKEEI